jgi:hypothetical protein
MVLIVFENRSVRSISCYVASRLKLMVFVKTASKLNLKDKMMRMYMQHKIDAFFIANLICLIWCSTNLLNNKSF